MREIKEGIAPKIRDELEQLDKVMPATEDLTTAPTKEDFNSLLAKLRAAGLMYE